MSLWSEASTEERYVAIYVLLGVLWLAYDHVREEDRRREEHRQRQSVTLQEEALERLERGESLSVPRWHGDDLELRAASTNTATSGRGEDVGDAATSGQQEDVGDQEE